MADDNLVKKLVDITESVTSKLADTQRKVDDLDVALQTGNGTIRNDIELLKTKVQSMHDSLESSASSFGDMQQKIEELDMFLQTSGSTLRNELDVLKSKVRSAQDSNSGEIKSLRAELTDKLSKLEAWSMTLESGLERDIDRGISKGTKQVGDDFEDLKKAMRQEMNETTEEVSVALKEMTIKSDALQSRVDSKNREAAERLEKET